DDARLLRRQPGELHAELRAELARLDRTLRIRLRRDAPVLDELLPGPRALPLRDVAARVDDEAVKPRRELRLAAELADAHAELRQRLLRRVARVLAIAEQMARQLLHARRMPLAERLQRTRVAVLCSSHQDGIAQPLVPQRLFLPQRLCHSTALRGRRLHGRRSLVLCNRPPTPCCRCSRGVSGGPIASSRSARRPSVSSRTTRRRARRWSPTTRPRAVGALAASGWRSPERAS